MKKNYKLYKIISIILLAFSLIGFILSSEKKDNNTVFEKRGTSKEFEFETELEGAFDYIISYWVVDEETGYQWASVSSFAEVFINDTLAESKTIDFSESDEKGGIKRAQNGFEYHFKPMRNTKVMLKGVLYKGDYWEWIIYKGISETENIRPGLFIILFLVSLFLFLKFRKINKQ